METHPRPTFSEWLVILAVVMIFWVLMLIAGVNYHSEELPAPNFPAPSCWHIWPRVEAAEVDGKIAIFYYHEFFNDGERTKHPYPLNIYIQIGGEVRPATYSGYVALTNHLRPH
ncbi:MAG: hypothetical protein AAB897_02945 [Patescibacteria group bacterium]